MKNPQLIYLKWADAHTNTSGWRTQEEADLWADNTDWFIQECGWLIKETKEYVAIATALKPENDYEEKQYLNLHKIPKGWIKERKVVDSIHLSFIDIEEMKKRFIEKFTYVHKDQDSLTGKVYRHKKFRPHQVTIVDDVWNFFGPYFGADKKPVLKTKPTHTIQVHDDEDFDKTKLVNFKYKSTVDDELINEKERPDL